jgi:hypothetical protein
MQNFESYQPQSQPNDNYAQLEYLYLSEFSLDISPYEQFDNYGTSYKCCGKCKAVRSNCVSFINTGYDCEFLRLVNGNPLIDDNSKVDKPSYNNEDENLLDVCYFVSSPSNSATNPKRYPIGECYCKSKRCDCINRKTKNRSCCFLF